MFPLKKIVLLMSNPNFIKTQQATQLNELLCSSLKLFVPCGWRASQQPNACRGDKARRNQIHCQFVRPTSTLNSMDAYTVNLVSPTWSNFKSCPGVLIPLSTNAILHFKQQHLIDHEPLRNNFNGQWSTQFCLRWFQPVPFIATSFG